MISAVMKIKQGSQPESDWKVSVPLSTDWQGGFPQWHLKKACMMERRHSNTDPGQSSASRNSHQCKGPKIGMSLVFSEGRSCLSPVDLLACFKQFFEFFCQAISGSPFLGARDWEFPVCL